MSEAETLIETLVLLAANKQSGTEVTAIRLVAEIRREQPTWSNVAVSQLIDDLASRHLGQIRAPQDDPGERDFFIDYRGIQFAQEVQERRRPKTIIEKLGKWSRADWMKLGLVIIAAPGLVVSVCTLLKPAG